jgi:molecular chaperone GrpE
MCRIQLNYGEMMTERAPDAAASAGTDAPSDQETGEFEALRTQLASAEAAAALAREQALRAAAELDNVRKRAARDVEQAQRYALERFAQELLGVADSLELAVANAGTADPASLVAGQEATLRLLTSAFTRFSIQPIEPTGAPFDPERHEAMAMQPSNTAEPGSVLQVVQRGYQLNGRLLRPARVIVAREPDAT